MPSNNRIPILAEKLRVEISSKGSAQTREWWVKYLKGTAQFAGVPMAEVRKTLKSWIQEHAIFDWTVENQKTLAFSLFESPISEDKLTGILFLSEYLLKEISPSDLPTFAQLFRRHLIQDWNICDWFAVKVLAKVLALEPEPNRFAKRLEVWCDSRDVWQRRAALVAFSPLAKKGERAFRGQTRLIMQIATKNVRHHERFSQTAVGWVLRELSRAEPGAVIQFLKKNHTHMSAECLSIISKNRKVSRVIKELREIRR